MNTLQSAAQDRAGIGIKTAAANIVSAARNRTLLWLLVRFLPLLVLAAWGNDFQP
jgi:hypothetical protein